LHNGFQGLLRRTALPHEPDTAYILHHDDSATGRAVHKREPLQWLFTFSGDECWPYPEYRQTGESASHRSSWLWCSATARCTIVARRDHRSLPAHGAKAPISMDLLKLAWSMLLHCAELPARQTTEPDPLREYNRPGTDTPIRCRQHLPFYTSPNPQDDHHHCPPAADVYRTWSRSTIGNL